MLFKRLIITTVLLLLSLSLIAIPMSLADVPPQEAPEVYLEALGTANVRSGPTIDYEVIAEISSGTEYRILRQHSLVPWYMIEIPAIPNGAGWVFSELVRVTRGNLATVPIVESYNAIDIDPPPGGAAPPPTPTDTDSETAPETSDSPPLSEGENVEAAPPATNVVIARLTGRANIRYAPGADFPIIATFDGGYVMTVLQRHASLPWFQVAVETSPTGTGWVYEEVVQIEGDIFTLPVSTTSVFDFPTPSATPNTVVAANSPFGEQFGSSGQRLAQTLGIQIDEFLLSLNIAPRTDREASVFMLDLSTGEHFTLNGNVAYSGMSINKIPVLLAYFIQNNRALDVADAELLANTMICSENTSTNRVMTLVGEGDILEGGRRVTEYMQRLGLGNTYVVAPFFTGNPDATPAPVNPIQTNADQQRSLPDLYNQLTVEEIGWLLGSMYQCAADGTGPIRDTFGDQVSQLECQQMLRLMRGNKIGRLLEASAEPGTEIAHKHGWVENTHGDAGIVFAPEGAYVLSMIYHERTTWLNYERSFPILEEIARQAWNHFNPSNNLQQPYSRDVPEVCNIYGEDVIPDLLSGNVDLPFTLSSAPVLPNLSSSDDESTGDDENSSLAPPDDNTGGLPTFTPSPIAPLQATATPTPSPRATLGLTLPVPPTSNP